MIVREYGAVRADRHLYVGTLEGGYGDATMHIQRIRSTYRGSPEHYIPDHM